MKWTDVPLRQRVPVALCLSFLTGVLLLSLVLVGFDALSAGLLSFLLTFRAWISVIERYFPEVDIG